MASFTSPLSFSTGALVRLPSPLPSVAGQGFEVRPIPGVIPPPPPREEPWARQSRQDQTEDRNRTRRANPGSFGPGSFGGSRPRGTPVPAFAPDGYATSAFLAQILGQDQSQDLGSAPTAGARHRDGAALGSEAYRRAGGEPVYYSEQPRILRIAV
jgi:hypothetical protein